MGKSTKQVMVVGLAGRGWVPEAHVELFFVKGLLGAKGDGDLHVEFALVGVLDHALLEWGGLAGVAHAVAFGIDEEVWALAMVELPVDPLEESGPSKMRTFRDYCGLGERTRRPG